MSLPANADIPDGSKYLDGTKSKNGLILLHGKGKHPTWLVVDPLRKGIHAKLGYHTLSLQMPTGHSNWKAYAKDFPRAYDIIKSGIEFLIKEKGVTTVYLLGHSMGSRMASAFISSHANHGLAGLLVVGCRNNGKPPLSCGQNLKNIRLPILDIWGGSDRKDSEAAAARNGMASESYFQIEIPQADHKFVDHEDELIDSVVAWLKNQQQVR